MKKISIGDKARAYDEAIERAKAMIKVAANQDEAIGFANTIFPELKESGDEKIRKELIRAFKSLNTIKVWNGIERTDILTWLEKQRYSEYELENEYWRGYDNGKKKGEQKLAWSEEDNNMVKWVIEYLDNKMLNTPISEERTACKNAIAWLEKLKDEKKPADKVEPKFKVGDKIQYLKGCGTIMTIEKIENDEYIFANNLGHTTIEDGNKWYLVERNLTWSEEDEAILDGVLTFIPDKEQKDWLKSLKDRVQPQPKQEWNKEDEDILNTIINHFEIDLECTENDDIIKWLKSLNPQPKQKWSEEDKNMLNQIINSGEHHCYLNLKEIDWLKSLKPQNRWKPSDEQIGVIEAVINNRSFQRRHLDSFYEQLKKLKGK